MHAVENIDIDIRLSVSVATGGNHGKRHRDVATGFGTVLRGVGDQKGERHIVVVWLYPARDSRATRSITFKPKPPVEREIHEPSSTVGSYSLLTRSHQRKQFERYVRHVSRIQQLDNQISWEYNSQ